MLPCEREIGCLRVITVCTILIKTYTDYTLHACIQTSQVLCKCIHATMFSQQLKIIKLKKGLLLIKRNPFLQQHNLL